jgi:hypothetical protein
MTYEERTMDKQDRNTPGPYAIRATPGSHDAEIYSEATGEAVARVLSSLAHGSSSPHDEMALKNAALLRAAPELHASLQRMLSGEPEHIRAESDACARQLLAKIAAGPGQEFREERAEELRAFEEMIDDQVREMSMNPDPWNEMREDEEMGHSF